MLLRRRERDIIKRRKGRVGTLKVVSMNWKRDRDRDLDGEVCAKKGRRHSS